MLSCCIEFPPQYGQYLPSLLVDIPITWNFVLQIVHTNVAAIIDSAIYNIRYIRRAIENDLDVKPKKGVGKK